MIIYKLKDIDSFIASETKPAPADRRKVRNTLRLPAVRAALVQWGKREIDFETLEKKLLGYISINAALIALAEEPEKEVLLWMRFVLNLRPGPQNAPRYLEALWHMARQTAWKEKDIHDICAYFARSMHRQAKRLRALESGQESATMLVADDTLPGPDQISTARDLLEEIRHASTKTQRKIVDLLYLGHSRADVSQILGKSADNIKTQLSDLRSRLRKKI